MHAISSTNSSNPLDVNADSHVSSLDALIVINSLDPGASGEKGALGSDFFLDVSGDGNVSPLDALLVINRLNETSLVAVEGEPSADLLGAPTAILEVDRWFTDLTGPPPESTDPVPSSKQSREEVAGNAPRQRADVSACPKVESALDELFTDLGNDSRADLFAQVTLLDHAAESGD
jgi:hypothetical protein